MNPDDLCFALSQMKQNKTRQPITKEEEFNLFSFKADFSFCINIHGIHFLGTQRWC